MISGGYMARIVITMVLAGASGYQLGQDEIGNGMILLVLASFMAIRAGQSR